MIQMLLLLLLEDFLDGMTKEIRLGDVFDIWQGYSYSQPKGENMVNTSTGYGLINL